MTSRRPSASRITGAEAAKRFTEARCARILLDSLAA